MIQFPTRQTSHSDIDMEELERLHARYLSLVGELRRQWWECSIQGQGNSDQAHVIWHLRSTLEQQARSIQLAKDSRGIAWLQRECSTKIRYALRELAPDWAEGKPLWWLWACRKEAAIFRLTRQAITKALRDKRERKEQSMTHLLRVGDRIAGHTALKQYSYRIYEDLTNQVVYRVIDGEVVTVHGDLECAQAAEQQYLATLEQREEGSIYQQAERYGLAVEVCLGNDGFVFNLTRPTEG